MTCMQFVGYDIYDEKVANAKAQQSSHLPEIASTNKNEKTQRKQKERNSFQASIQYYVQQQNQKQQLD